jgi:branched-chain amino acid transport system ATP-binding protein
VTAAAPVLAIHGVNKAFGGLVVARDVSLSLPAGARTALIGPNGAGKTTLVNLITGALPPTSGTIALDGRDVSGLSQPQRVRLGLVRTFQITRLFRDMSVRDHVRLAVLERRRRTWAFFTPVSREPGLEQEVDQVLASLALLPVAERIVRELAYGQQRLVEIALALALKPRVLLLDEPAAGVPQGESAIILDAIAGLPAELPVLIIEHDMELVFRFARHIIVLVQGATFATGTPAEIGRNPEVRKVYLGEKRHGRA